MEKKVVHSLRGMDRETEKDRNKEGEKRNKRVKVLHITKQRLIVRKKNCEKEG